MQLTVFFDGQYWVGIAEHEEAGRFFVVRHVFGPEPSPATILAYVRRDLFADLDSVSGDVTIEDAPKAVNPKRARRETHRLTADQGVSRVAWEAMRAQIEARSSDRAEQTKEDREAAVELRWELRRLKAKDRHRGR